MAPPLNRCAPNPRPLPMHHHFSPNITLQIVKRRRVSDKSYRPQYISFQNGTKSYRRILIKYTSYSVNLLQIPLKNSIY